MKHYKPYLDSRVAIVTRFDQEFHYSGAVIRGVLITINASEVAFITLTGEEEFRSISYYRVFIIESVFFYKLAQNTIGFQLIVVLL